MTPPGGGPASPTWRSRLARAVPAFAGTGDPDDFLRCFATPADVLVLVAGRG